MLQDDLKVGLKIDHGALLTTMKVRLVSTNNKGKSPLSYLFDYNDVSFVCVYFFCILSVVLLSSCFTCFLTSIFFSRRLSMSVYLSVTVGVGPLYCVS